MREHEKKVNLMCPNLNICVLG